MRVLLTADFGDAPVPYPTATAEDGAQHEATGPMLGAIRDGEADGVHSPTANADDTAGTPSDEDGVTFGTIRVGALGATATVVVTNAPSGAKLDAWIDFNGDGNWGGSQEQIANNVAVVNGSNTIAFDVPSDAIDGLTFARFRLSTVGNLGPEGAADNGEVEDHSVTLIPPAASGRSFDSRTTISNTAIGVHWVTAADLDGDGDLDVLSASRDNDTIAWYPNGGFQSFSARTVGIADGAICVDTADLDGDGDLDVLSASAYDNKINWYQNDGNENFTTRTISSTANYAYSVTTADVDNDGDLDVLSASISDDKIAWYENDGNQNFTAHNISTTANGACSVAAADIDGDGDIDVVSASLNDGRDVWYENNGSQIFTAHTLATNASGLHSVSAVDMDNDGDLDIFTSSNASRAIGWYENDGGQNFTTRDITPLGGDDSQAFVADLDGDGDLDVVVAESSQNYLPWYENDGHQNFTKHTISKPNYGLVISVYAADMDRDGDLDVLSASYNDNTVGWNRALSDTTPPTLSIIPNGVKTNAAPITFTFQFSEPVSDFTVGDVVLTNGFADTLTAVDGDTYTLLVTPVAEGTVSVNVAASSVRDASMNGNTAASASVNSDRTSPTLSITPNATSTNGNPITFTFQFSEAVSGFTSSDVLVTSGSASNFIAVDGDTYTIRVTPAANGTAAVNVAANAAQDLATNGNTTASASVTDITPPTLSVTPNTPTTNGNPVTFTFQFSEVVNGFSASDILVTNGDAGAFVAIDGDTYTLVVTPSGNESLSVSVPAGVAQDLAANGNAEKSATALIDRTSPTLTITPNQTATNAGFITFTFQFSEVVTGFIKSEVVITNGSAGTFTANGAIYTLSVTPTSDGPVSVNVAANVAQDAAANGNAAASASVTSDRTKPTLAISPNGTMVNADSVLFTFQFNELVSGFTASDIQLTNGTAGSFTAVDGDTYTLLATPRRDGLMSVFVNAFVAQDAAGNSNGTSRSASVTADVAPIVDSFVSLNASFGATNSEAVVFRATFSEAVSNVDVTDFTVHGETTATVTSVSEVSNSNGREFDITVSGGDLAHFDGLVGLDLSASQDIIDLTGKALLTQEPDFDHAIYVDHTAPTVTSFVRYSPTAATTNFDELTFRVEFDEAMLQIDVSDFRVQGMTTAQVTEVDPVDLSTFDIIVSGGDLEFFNGPVGLDFSATAQIVDYAGNSLVPAEPAIDEVFTLDDSLPEYFVTLVREIFPGGESSSPENITDVNGTLYFSADDGTHGRELWKSDGTAAGTVLVNDLREGEESSEFLDLINVNGKLFFFVIDSNGEWELWKSDGTNEGTVLVTLLNARVGNLGVAGDSLFFSANDDVRGTELWVSDGTSAGTGLLKDIQVGGGSSGPHSFINVHGTIFFTADDGVHGRELWKSDGSPSGTVLVVDLNSGDGDSDFSDFVAIGNTLFFAADDGSHGRELWKTDGTISGTVLLTDLTTGTGGTDPYDLTDVSGTLFFTGSADGHLNRPIWKSDGTAAGTSPVQNTNGINGTELINVGGTLYFISIADNGFRSLWKSDGTGNGTVAVIDESMMEESIDIGNLLNIDNQLFFMVNETLLARTDGTFGGSELVAELAVSLDSDDEQSFAISNGSLFFRDEDGSGGFELFRTTTIAPPPTAVRRLSDMDSGNGPYGFAAAEGQIFFLVDESSLWKTEGTFGSTVPVVELPGPVNSELTPVGGTVFFAIERDYPASELWKSDGTAAGTVMVKNFIDIEGYVAEEVVNVNGLLFFQVRDPDQGWMLWKSDGTAGGTVLVKEFRNGDNDYFPAHLTNVDGVLFFAVDDGVHGVELWKSDGTADGTVLVKDIHPGTGSETFLDLQFAGFVNANGTLFFAADDGVHGRELWKSDGTAEGTVLVRDFAEGGDGSEPQQLTAVGSAVCFVTYNDLPILWKSDGTAEGTTRLTDDDYHDPADLTNVGDILFFTDDVGDYGRELWKSNGTAEGTALVRNIAASWRTSFPQELTDVNGTLFFVANDRISGMELWKSDGTSEGTVLVQDIAPGGNGSFPTGLANANGTLFFNAEDEDHGREVWIVEPPDEAPPTVSSIVRDSNLADDSQNVRWKVVFDEPVRGVHLDDFQLVTAGFTGAAITEFVGSGTTYFVTATTGTGTGSIALRLVDNGSIHDSFLNPLGGEGTSGAGDGGLLGEAFVMDSTPPTVASMTRTSANRTNASDVSWTVVFSEDVSGVNLGDFSLLATGVTGASITSVTGSGTTWLVTASTGSGDGTLGIKLVDDDSITDAAGNPLAGNFTGQVYTLDRTTPSAVSFLRQSPSSSPTNADTLVFRAAFSEAVLNVDAVDFAVSGSTATVTSVAAVNGSNKQFDVTVAGGDLASFNGLVGLNLYASPTIVDLAGNSLGTAEPLTDHTYLLDNAAPSVTSILRQSDVANRERPNSLVFRVTFSEGVSGIQAADFAVNGATTATVTGLSGVSGSGGKSFDVTVSGGNLASFNGSVGLNLSATQDIADAAGNALPNAEPTNDQSYSVVAYQDLAYAVTGNSVLAVRVVSGRLEVKIGNVLQPAVAPEMVESLTFTGGSKGDSINLAGLSSSLYSHLTRIVISGGVGNDTITGSDFAETISGGLGNDALRGGGGIDCLAETGDVSFVLTNSRLTGLGTDSLTGIEKALLTGGDQANKLDASAFTGQTTLLGGSGNDTLIGGGGDDSLEGSLGDDLLAGNGGDDFLSGSADDDTLGGGAGDDQLFGGSGTDQVVASGGTAYVLNNLILIGNGTDTLNKIESATITTSAQQNSSINASDFDGSVVLIGGAGLDTLTGGSGDDSLFGAAGNDVLNGGGGRDFLRGEAGNDTLNGEDGNDLLLGSVGNDALNGGDGIDRLIELANANLVLTDSTLTGIGTDALSSVETASLTGGGGNNTLNAAAFTLGSVTLVGGAGNDSLVGGSSDDSLDGGVGNDTLRGGDGNDELEGGVGNDGLVGQSGNDSLRGGEGKDTLLGGIGDDTLRGGLQDDLLVGGLGADTLNGDIGNDKATGGQGKTGSPRNGNSAADLGDVITAEVIDETFAKLFAFE